MYDYLEGKYPDSYITLSVSPSHIEESAHKNQVVIRCDDLTEEVVSASDDPFFMVSLSWNVKSESDSGTMMDFWLSFSRGNGIKNSFLWYHNYDGYTYVVKFASNMTRSLLTSSIFRPANFTLRVLGYCSAAYYLYYDLDEQTGSFTVGNTIYGATSGESAVIESIDTVNGRLWLTSISGSFTSGEVIYEAVYSDEIATLGDCSTDWFDYTGSKWTHNAGTEQYDIDGSQASNDLLSAFDLVEPVGAFFRIVFEVDNYSAGIIWQTAGASDYQYTQRTSDGTYTEYKQSKGTNDYSITADSDFIGSVDNISIKRITNASLAIGTNTAPAAYYLSYDSDNQTGEFTVGNTIYGGTSGAYGVIERIDKDNEMLFLTGIFGTFSDGEIIYEATYGAEILTDPGIESWVGDVPVYWDNTNSSVITNETGTVHGGSHSLKFVASAQYEGANTDDETIVGTNYYVCSFYIYGDATNHVAARVQLDNGTTIYHYFDGMADGNQYAPPASWNQHSIVFFANGRTIWKLDIFAEIGETAGTHYIDDASLKQVINAALAVGTQTAI